jgi:hypothetical protein
MSPPVPPGGPKSHIFVAEHIENVPPEVLIGPTHTRP